VGTVFMVSKRDRFHRALAARQRSDGHGAGVLRFVKIAMRPARYARALKLSLRL
jgi:hypothetical protein